MEFFYPFYKMFLRRLFCFTDNILETIVLDQDAITKTAEDGKMQNMAFETKETLSKSTVLAEMTSEKTTNIIT